MTPLLPMALALVALAACAPGAPSNDDLDAGTPKPDAIDDDAIEAGDDAGDDARPDSGDAAPDADPLVPEARFVRAHLKGGQQVEGELLATYDHRIWWEPEDRTTWAIFDPASFAPWPDDRSVRLLSDDEVERIEEIPPPEGVPTYFAFLRRRGLTVRRSPLLEPAFVITANDRYHPEENGFGDHALDLVLTDAQGVHFKGDGTANPQHHIWDQPVVLPTRGYVVEVIDDAPDNDPGPYPPDAVNNLVGVHIGGSYYLYALHLRQGSVPEGVAVGVELPDGTPIGRVGNSGVTLEPHLHLVLLWYDASADSPRSWSLPLHFESLEVSDAPTGPSARHPFATPHSGLWISSEPF